MSSPIAVLTSDLHFNLNTLEIASQALRAALAKAEALQLPLIIAGDLQDTKAIIRGEVANRLIEILQGSSVKVFILRGNHDQLSEKTEEHALNYLRPYATIVDAPRWYQNLLLIPYQNQSESLAYIIKNEGVLPDSILVVHQGFLGAAMGDYIQDKSSISPDAVKDFTVISGHYHKHQIIGTVTYIGSPYTITFGEANDGQKGYLILNSDGTFTREILNLRKHVILNANLTEESLDFHVDPLKINPDDLVWLKIHGPQSLLQKVNKQKIGLKLFGHANYKLDLIGTESVPKEQPVSQYSDKDILDKIIDEQPETEHQRRYLKSLWKELI